ncbi:MAG: sigma-70 family RNA polymerase sigma factor [Anaerolineales bacterium]|nr:sigma-70 family RNA polymerase sigma factor [Anaerolineales bacterium]
MDETKTAIRRLKAGDLGGLQTLVEQHQVRAVRTAFLILQDEAAAQDVVQDVFLKLYRNIRHFDEARPFEPYLLKSVVHAALNLARRDRKLTSLEGNPALAEQLLTGDASPENLAEARARADEILSALAQLSPRQRATIVQRYYLEMSEKEMSERLDVAPGTIKWLLNAARARLRNILNPERSSQ